MILTVCLNPVLQKTIVLPSYNEDEVNRSAEHRFYLSGKGVNVSRVLSQLGERTVHITFSGGIFDPVFRALAKRETYPLIAVPSKTELRFCYTILNIERTTATEVVEEGSPVDKATGTRIRKVFEQQLDRAQAVVISGTKAPGFNSEIIPSMVKQAKAQGKIVLLDCRESDLVQSLRYRPDFIKINRYEFAQTFMRGKSNNLHQTMLAVERDSASTVILTDGKNAISYTHAGVIRVMSPKSIRVVNPIGSGDSFAAGFISRYLRTGSVSKAVLTAELCARKNAQHLMAGTIR